MMIQKKKKKRIHVGFAAESEITRLLQIKQVISLFEMWYLLLQ